VPVNRGTTASGTKNRRSVADKGASGATRIEPGGITRFLKDKNVGENKQGRKNQNLA